MSIFRSTAGAALRLSVGSTILTLTAFAAPPVATVTSAVPFVLDGHSVSSPGVTTFPIVAGDTVATTNGPAVLVFHDGSTVKLSDNSSARIDTVGTNPKVILLAGALDYKLVAGSNVKVTNLDTVRKPSAEVVPSVATSRSRVGSVLSSPGFIISAGGSAVGLASVLNPFSSGENAAGSATSSATPIAHLPPVSRHL